MKHISIYQIAGINNKSFLNAIKNILEKNSESIIYKTTSEQKKINEGREQIANREFFTNDQVEKEIYRWLNGIHGMVAEK